MELKEFRFRPRLSVPSLAEANYVVGKEDGGVLARKVVQFTATTNVTEENWFT